MNALVEHAPLCLFLAVTLVVRLVGSRRAAHPRRRRLGLDLGTSAGALCLGLAALFALTGTSHFVGLRSTLERMVPPGIGSPAFWITFTGLAELAGAAGLLLTKLRPLAAFGLALLLVAVFPANLRESALEHRGWASLAARAAEQFVYLASVGWVGLRANAPARRLAAAG